MNTRFHWLSLRRRRPTCDGWPPAQATYELFPPPFSSSRHVETREILVKGLKTHLPLLVHLSSTTFLPAVAFYLLNQADIHFRDLSLY